jgi:hypothetical protein
LHVTGGHGSPYSTFNKPNAASSHFFVYKNGVVEQFVDTAYRAEADLEGNDATVSIETEGGTPAPVVNSEKWTDAQFAAIKKLVNWIMDTHNIPKKLATDSKIGGTSRGLSWHRLGIDGNFPELPNPGAGRIQRGGGMHYSTSFGKECPGLAKINQIPLILEEDMAITDDDVKKIVGGLLNYKNPNVSGGDIDLYALLRQTKAYAQTAAAGSGASDVDEAQVAALVLEGLTPEKIAAAIPATLAKQVADELAKRLAS